MIADDGDLLDIAAHCRAGQQPPNLFFAAVHYLLLNGHGRGLARFYPSIAGDAAAPAEDAGPAFRGFCLEHRDELIALVETRLVQTHVVKRSATLLVGLSVVASEATGPVQLVEVGACAGIHLLFDRYRFEIGGRVFGDGDSNVVIRSQWRSPGPVPALDRMPTIARRVGIDLNPVDPADADQRLWLEALVWPENRHEATLLRQALSVVEREPPLVRRGDAVDLLPQLDDELTPDPVVVFHAATRAHVPCEARASFDAAIDALGRRRALFWLSSEGPLYPDPRIPTTAANHVLGLRRGADDRGRHLALVEGHAEWFVPLDLAPV